jgi:hypothetical protein
MGKGGDQQIAARPRREDFLYSEQASSLVPFARIQTHCAMHVRHAGLDAGFKAARVMRACVRPRAQHSAAHAATADNKLGVVYRRSRMPRERRKSSRSTPRSRSSCGPSP